MDESLEITNTPIADKIESTIEMHGHVIIDNYAWMKDKNIADNPDSKILTYIKEENKYAEAFFNSTEVPSDNIFEELKSRIKLDDQTVPVQHGDYHYFMSIDSSSNYWTHKRFHKNTPENIEIVLDENELAKGTEFFSLGDAVGSHNDKLLAYCTDVHGNEKYNLYVKDLSTGNLLPDYIEDVNNDIIWLQNDEGFLYIKNDDTLRPYQVYYHKLGASEDKLIYQEDNDLYRVALDESADEKYIFIYSCSADAYEVNIMPSNNKFELNKFISKEQDLLFELEHGNDAFYALINDKGKNFRLIKTTDLKTFEEIIPHDKNAYLTDLNIYKGYIAVNKVVNGLNQVQIISADDNSQYSIPMAQASYAASIISTNYENTGVRYSYSSLNTPSSVLHCDFKTHDVKTLKVQEIPSGFNGKDYTVERIFVESTNGAKVPVSVLYKTDLFKNDGSNPLYLYGYGSYGLSIKPAFNTNIISLVDRGFVYALAHIRGGDDLGYEWYEQTKTLNKKLTFDDFINVTKYLCNNKYTTEGNVVCVGGSAGGMLVGVTINREPSLYKATVAHVPFVDVLNTMLDDTLPLTTNEYLQWGNPNEKEAFEYIKSYSPYDNIENKAYPNLFVTTSIDDTRVAYWESAKWVAKLREYKTNDNLIIFETNLTAGHGGASGRFGYLKDKAKEYAFILEVFKN